MSLIEDAFGLSGFYTRIGSEDAGHEQVAKRQTLDRHTQVGDEKGTFFTEGECMSYLFS